MHEDHSLDQYFFDEKTVAKLADFASRFSNPCLLCMPMIGMELEKRGMTATTLDIDERFSHLKGFRKFDLYRPTPMGENYGLILCDPPFFKVKLSQLFSAIRVLANNKWEQPLGITYVKRREFAFLGTFAKFNLQATGYNPGYVTIQPAEHNKVELYTNTQERI